VRVLVTVPAAGLAALDAGTTSFALVVRDAASGHQTARTTQFQRPALIAPARSP
jgi:hypothetical protein